MVVGGLENGDRRGGLRGRRHSRAVKWGREPVGKLPDRLRASQLAMRLHDTAPGGGKVTLWRRSLTRRASARFHES